MQIDLTTIIVALIGLLAIGVVIKVIVNKKSYRVIQRDIKSSGDVAGRDIKK